MTLTPREELELADDRRRDAIAAMPDFIAAVFGKDHVVQVQDRYGKRNLGKVLGPFGDCGGVVAVEIMRHVFLYPTVAELLAWNPDAGTGAVPLIVKAGA